jgi:inner membrane protein
MLAVNHALFSLNSALLISVHFNIEFYLPLLILTLFSGVLPDIDHPNSELGRYFKVVGKFLPHRGITHSLLGFGIFYFVLQFLFQQSHIYFTYFLIFCSFFGLYLGRKILRKQVLRLDDITKNLISPKQANYILEVLFFILNINLIILLLLVWNNELRNQIFQLLLIGYVSHLIGDFVTKEGIPVFYPLKNKLGLKLFKTGGLIEGLLGFIMFASLFYLLYLYGQKYDFYNVDYWLKFVKI